MSTRELRNAPESNAAINLCVARWIADDVGLEGHIRDVSEGGCCPTCRADVVRLVDAPPRERVPEVSPDTIEYFVGQIDGSCETVDIDTRDYNDGQTSTCHLDPIKCEACGADIELACPNGCEGRKRANWQRAFEQLRDSVQHHFGALPGDFEQIMANVFTAPPKPAIARLAPAAAARHPSTAPKHGTVDNRIYQPKPCKRCGKTFQPTGPRALYCGCSEAPRD